MISTQEWGKAIGYINYHKPNLNAKGKNGLSARELAADKINKVVERKYWCRAETHTPLEYFLWIERMRGKKGIGEDALALIALGAKVNQKNSEGNNALMFYLKTIVEASQSPSFKIIKLLIHEGADFSPNNAQENPLEFTKKHFGKLLADYMQRQVHVIDLQLSRVITIQRTCRSFLYRKQNQKHFRSNAYGPRSAKEITRKIPMHPKLTLKPKVPISNNSIDPVKAQAWINLHDLKDQNLAAKVLKKIDHVSYERFVFALKQTIEKWNVLIMSRPESQRNYTILLDQREEKSIAWVTSLALSWLAHPPAQIITWERLELINEDSHHIVILDDAVYSGNQMTATVDSLLQLRVLPELQYLLDKEYHIIVPFISESGKKRLAERDEINVIYHETIPNFNIKGLNGMGMTATYFDHKIAQEGISTINIIRTGKTIRGKPGVMFVPPTKEPYKSSSNSE